METEQMASERWRAPRSLLFLPATRLDLLAKVDRWSPDLVAVDLEDAVKPEERDAARQSLTAALADGALDDVEAAVLVRMNAPGTRWHEAELVELTECVPGTARGVIVPKVESVHDLQRVRSAFAREDRARAFVLGGVETARGVADSRVLLSSGLLDAVYFGAEDYISDLGGVRTAGGDEVRVARALVALHARVGGVPALDQAQLAFGDRRGLAEETMAARALGYGGKICIHPSQVEVVHDALRPTEEEVKHARAVLEAVQNGVGVLDGAMVDAVHVRMAEQILARMH